MINGKIINFPHPNENEKNYQTFEQPVLQEVNSLRESNGVHPLTLNSQLAHAVHIRAYESYEQFVHYRPDGSYFLTVFDDYHIDYPYTSLSENIAYGPEMIS